MPRLLVIKGADEGKQFELKDPVVGIGRDAASKIRLHDTEVSRRHAELRREGAGWAIADLGSTNGIKVNGRRVSEAPLEPGDRVTLGVSDLTFEID